MTSTRWRCTISKSPPSSDVPQNKCSQDERRDKKANKANEMQEFIFALLSRRAEVRGVKGLHFVMAKPKSIKLVEFFLKKQ